MPKVVAQDPAVTKRATCKKCGAINEYTPNEVRVLYKGRDISQCMCTTEGFNCAQCGAEVITFSD
jgi:transcription initiation factor IIE alpha subunit